MDNGYIFDVGGGGGIDLVSVPRTRPTMQGERLNNARLSLHPVAGHRSLEARLRTILNIQYTDITPVHGTYPRPHTPFVYHSLSYNLSYIICRS